MLFFFPKNIFQRPVVCSFGFSSSNLDLTTLLAYIYFCIYLKEKKNQSRYDRALFHRTSHVTLVFIMSIAGSENHLHFVPTFRLVCGAERYLRFYQSTKASTKFHPLSTSRVFLGGRIVFLPVEKLCESELYSALLRKCRARERGDMNRG